MSQEYHMQDLSYVKGIKEASPMRNYRGRAKLCDQYYGKDPPVDLLYVNSRMEQDHDSWM